jgi:protein OPY2
MTQSSHHFPSLIRRCVECPTDIPSCPSCPTDETCLLQSQSCDECQSAICVKVGALSGEPAPRKPSSTPAIAGGVAGGVLFIIIVTFLIWWFCIRKRRQEWDDQVWTETDQSISGVEKRDQSGLNREARQSTRSIGSIASTVRTRASNVIQIAYIPGVTNRSPTESPGLLIPPVPPIPMGSATTSTATSPNYEQDRHFFMPNDLRDSTCSDVSGRQSLSPSLARASMATTLYRSHAEVSPRPAQQALRAKAAVVTVNKGSNSPSDSGTPDVATAPQIPQAQKGMANSSIVARTVTARPIQVKKSNSGKKSQVPTLANLQAASANKRVSLRLQAGNMEDRSEDETDANTRLISPSSRSQYPSTPETIFEVTPGIKQSQFTDTSSSSSGSISEASAAAPPRASFPRSTPAISRSSHSGSASALGQKHQKSGSLNSLIEEAMSRAARDPIHGGLGSISENHNHSHSYPLSQGLGSPSQSQSHGREDSLSLSSSLTGPFSDANELRESTPRPS